MPEISETQYIDLAQQIANSTWFENLSPPLRVALFLSLLGLTSTLLVTLTAFTRIIIVLSFVRRALSTQEIPPNSVLIGLAIFLTLFIMGPTLDTLVNVAVNPYVSGEKNGPEAFRAGTAVMHEFLLKHTRRSDLAFFVVLSDTPPPTVPEATPFRVLIPAFVISEVKTAFLMGFCIYLPFLLIDLVVSTILMSLGMMMVPPMIMSLPFKILLFILVDGWTLVISSLGQSFG